MHAGKVAVGRENAVDFRRERERESGRGNSGKAVQIVCEGDNSERTSLTPGEPNGAVNHRGNDDIRRLQLCLSDPLRALTTVRMRRVNPKEIKYMAT